MEREADDQNPPCASEVSRLTVTRAAARADVHPATVDRACRAGALSFAWHFGRRLIDARDLDAWIASKAQRIGRRP